MTNSEIQKLVKEKIYSKYITEQIPEIKKDIPIWLKYCDKATAQELKPLCKPYRSNTQDFFYLFWLPKSYENYDKNTTNFHELKHFEKTFPEFLQELENIISGKEDNRERERERERRFSALEARFEIFSGVHCQDRSDWTR